MTRIGKLPITIPSGVDVVVDRNQVTIKGKKGELTKLFSPDMYIELDKGVLMVKCDSKQRHHRALHGLTRALINNMVVGVHEGFSVELTIEGVGYKASISGKDLVLNVGYSHPVIFEASEQIAFEVDKSGRVVTVRGIHKELVGEIASRIRRTRPPEPYKGKGVFYKGEKITRKAGKTGKK